MVKKLKIIISIFVVVLILSIVSCKCNKNNDNYQLLETGIATSVNDFKSAVIEMVLTTEDVLLYQKKMSVNKENSGSSYIIKIKEFSEDLSSPSLYNESESEGSLTNEETIKLFPLSDQFKEENITDFVRNDNQVEFKIGKENVMSVFDLENEDINRISNEGIQVIINYDGDRIKDYSYLYKTNHGVDVKIIGSFIF